MKETKKQIILSCALIGIICLTLIITSSIALTHISTEQENKTKKFLNQTTMQYKDSIEQQVYSNWETLQGISTFVEKSDISEEKLLEILKEENKNNRFYRIGIIHKDASALMNTQGDEGYRRISLKNMDYVNEVLQGKNVLSKTLPDYLDDGYINVYAVPIYKNGVISGAICAVNRSSMFTNIVNLSSMDSGFADIVDREGNLIIRSKNDVTNQNKSNFFVGDSTKYRNDMKQGKSDSFVYTFNNVEYLANYTPLSVNDWYLISVVPRTIITEHIAMISHTGLLIVIIIIILLSILLLFITRLINRSKKHLEYIAYYDSLTKAFTKNKFLEEANNLLQSDCLYSILYMDVANFKQINELFGNQVADKLLIHISNIFQNNLNKNEIFYRDYADCFGILLHEQQMDRITERIQSLIHEITNNEFHPLQHYRITCCTGVKIIENFTPDNNLNILMNRAMTALREAKKTSNGCITFYNQTLHDKFIQQSDIEKRMISALENDEFKVYFQPKYATDSLKIVGAEALIRWQSNGTLMYPDSFIPIFEKNGFIVNLDMYVFSKVCSYIRKWNEEGLPSITININQSRLLFYSENYLAQVTTILESYNISTNRIMLEVTEGIAVDDPSLLKKIIDNLHALGIPVSMDDFGSGYSSLNILQDLNFDEIKLDRVFLSQASENREKQRNIIMKIIELCKSLSIYTVAEGVETKEQYEFLKSIHCDCIQGYYLAKPQPVEEFEALLRCE